MKPLSPLRTFAFVSAVWLLTPPAPAGDLGTLLEPYLRALGGREATFELRAHFQGKIDGSQQEGKLRLVRGGEESFLLELEHKEHPVRIERTAERTLVVVPGHKVAFLGTGRVSGPDTLAPRGLAGRLFSEDSAVFPVASVLTGSTGPLAARLLEDLVGLTPAAANAWRLSKPGDATLTFSEAGDRLQIEARGARLELEHAAKAPEVGIAAEPPAGFTVTAVERGELERVLVRGARRALEVVAPGPALAQPLQETRRTEGGELRWVNGMRLALLRGTPSQIGTAHGKLLAAETRRCLESTVYMVGGADTVARGRWFLDELRGAYRRLEKFIPEAHKEEIDALASAAGLPVEELRLANVFPELFHCSGFAVFGKATVDGKLYHGRVLDYMTLIGLHDAATLFVVAGEGKIAFANVGYAGFVGSVSGMNVRGISLGEMGGRGEGKWDGVPMATLMRRALEECETLASVRNLWSSSPRTCEYYYVFADGKIPDAVGVAATPEKVEFIRPGEGHDLLGEGIPDAVVLSAGDRLKTLRDRVTASHGKIDVEKALWLMSRPVAMRSNLHNALFIPQDLVLHVAHADHDDIAANRPYTRFDLRALVAELAASARK